MRVAIIAANNIRYSPYIFFYTDILTKAGMSYELIYPDRNGIEERFEGIAHALPWHGHLPTMLSYALYAKEVIKVVKRQQYDALIVLTGVNAAYLALWLKRHDAQKYVVDIRDFSHENIRVYRALESVAVHHSLMNVISSVKFKQFLPDAAYHVCHNCDPADAERAVHSFSKAEGQVRIGYVGSLSYVEQCQQLMKLVAQDERFCLEFYGTSKAESVLQEYAKQLSCSRICFHGGYAPCEKAEIIGKVDILFNAYGNGTPLLDCALSNKLYDALIHKKAILTCPNTYMTEMGGCMAFPIDLAEDNTLDALYEWYRELDGEQLVRYADGVLAEVLRENAMTKAAIAEKLRTVDAKGAE